MKLDEFLQIKGVKLFCICINPILIGALFSSLGSWDFKGDNFICIKIILTVILFLTYIVSMYRYYKIEDNIKNTLSNLENEVKIHKTENKIYSKITLILTSLFKTCADSINTISKNILVNKAKLDNWNYAQVCNVICNAIYELLCLISGESKFYVNIMLYDTKAKGKSKNIKMIAHKGKYEGDPDTFGKPLNMNTYKDFYAVKMFKKNSPQISILTTSEDIKEKFVFSSDKTEHPNYTQYVGVPIHCSGNQMLSLLQICSFDNTKIGNNKEEIMQMVNDYILPFTYFALLNNKIEKGFMNSISLLQKENK